MKTIRCYNLLSALEAPDYPAMGSSAIVPWNPDTARTRSEKDRENPLGKPSSTGLDDISWDLFDGDWLDVRAGASMVWGVKGLERVPSESRPPRYEISPVFAQETRTSFPWKRRSGVSSGAARCSAQASQL